MKRTERKNKRQSQQYNSVCVQLERLKLNYADLKEQLVVSEADLHDKTAEVEKLKDQVMLLTRDLSATQADRLLAEDRLAALQKSVAQLTQPAVAAEGQGHRELADKEPES